MDYDESAVTHVRSRYPRVEVTQANLAELPLEGEAGYRDVAPAALRLAGDVAHPLVIGAV